MYYCVVSKELLNDVLSFQVMPLTELSNHCPIWFALKLRSNPAIPLHNDTNSLDNLPKSYKWNVLLKDKFLKSLSTSDSLKNITSFNEQSFNEVKPRITDIDCATSMLTNIIIEAAEKSLPSKYTRKKRFVKKRKWLTQDCNSLRKQLRVLGKSLRGEYFNLKKKYRKETKLAKKRYEEKFMNHLEDVRSSNPKEYWNLIKMINNNAESNKALEIDSTSWFNYF